MSSSELTEETLQRQDAVVAVTDHSDYNWAWIVERTALVIDTRNATGRVPEYQNRIVRA
jgi:UDP-N-acetyl-D-glucosamine dehydrogenase